MSNTALTQYEADALIKMDKIPANGKSIELPDFGGRVEVQLQSQTGQENFILNYWRGTINILKRNHNLRGRHTIGLVRLDLGHSHRNPDGVKIGPRHLHLYREGYGLLWAFKIPETEFPDLDNTYKTLEDFLKYCHVTKMPNFNRGLFS